MQKQNLNSRLDKLPQPFSLNLRTKKDRLAIQSKPYRVQLDSTLQSLDNQTTMGTIKQQLSNIKRSVQRMVCDEEQQKEKPKQDVAGNALRDELQQQRELGETLKEEAEELRSLLKDADKREQIKTDQHIKDMKARWRKEKAELSQKVADLEADLKKAGISQNKLKEKHQEELENLNSKLEQHKNNQKKLTREAQINKNKLITLQQELEIKQTKIQQQIKLANSLQNQLRELKSEAKQKDHLIKRLNQQIQDISKQSEVRLGNTVLEFKKFEQRFNSQNEEAMSKFRVKAEELQSTVDRLQQEKDTLRNQNNEFSGKLDRVKAELRESKNSYEELAEKMRGLQYELALAARAEPAKIGDPQKVRELQQKIVVLEENYRIVCAEVEKQKNIASQLEVSRLRGEKTKIDTELQAKDQEIKNLMKEIFSKNAQIKSLRQQITLLQASLKQSKQLKDLVTMLQSRCQKLSQQQIQASDEYELKILKLQNQVQQLKDASLFNQSSSRLLIAQQPSTATFDHALKNQLSDYDSLKAVVKTKQQEIHQLKTTLEQLRSKNEAIQSQMELQKLLSSGEERKIKTHYETLVENLTNELESHKRKGESLQQKLDYRTNEIKNKDQFISQTIVTKIGKTETITETEFIKSKLQEFLKAFTIHQAPAMKKV